VQSFDALIAELAHQDIERSGEVVKRKLHRAALPAQLQNTSEIMQKALTAKPFDPPSRKELTPNANAQQVMRFLIQTGEVVELTSEVVLSRQSFEQMRDAVIARIRMNRPATVSELRSAIGTSRRIMVPFLERLDRDGVTLRVGDKRKLR
jgi:selenocysteine-specific elongation factor